MGRYQDLLEDGDDAFRNCYPGRTDSGRCLPQQLNSPAIGPVDARQDLTRVLLPEPFSPMIVWTSPSHTSNEQLRKASVDPNRLARSLTRSTKVAAGGDGTVAAGATSVWLSMAVRPPLSNGFTSKSCPRNFYSASAVMACSPVGSEDG